MSDMFIQTTILSSSWVVFINDTPFSGCELKFAISKIFYTVMKLKWNLVDENDKSAESKVNTLVLKEHRLKCQFCHPTLYNKNRNIQICIDSSDPTNLKHFNIW